MGSLVKICLSCSQNLFWSKNHEIKTLAKINTCENKYHQQKWNANRKVTIPVKMRGQSTSCDLPFRRYDNPPEFRYFWGRLAIFWVKYQNWRCVPQNSRQNNFPEKWPRIFEFFLSPRRFHICSLPRFGFRIPGEISDYLSSSREILSWENERANMYIPV